MSYEEYLEKLNPIIYSTINEYKPYLKMEREDMYQEACILLFSMIDRLNNIEHYHSYFKTALANTYRTIRVEEHKQLLHIITSDMIINEDGDEVSKIDLYGEFETELDIKDAWLENYFRYRKEYLRNYYHENREKLLIKSKIYKQTHKEEIKEQGKRYREKHKEEIREKKKEYSRNNRDKINEYSRKWANENKDKIKGYKKDYYEKNKDKIKERKKEYRKQYYQEHKEELREYNKKYKEEHKEELKEKNKKYRDTNREKINAKRREQQRLKKLEEANKKSSD